jgi:hypothetical protein
MRRLTKENLLALGDGERSRLVAILVTPELLAQMLGQPIPDGAVLDAVNTWDEYVVHMERGEEYLLVTPSLRKVNAPEPVPGT